MQTLAVCLHNVHALLEQERQMSALPVLSRSYADDARVGTNGCWTNRLDNERPLRLQQAPLHGKILLLSEAVLMSSLCAANKCSLFFCGAFLLPQF